MKITGLHHVTAIASDPQSNLDFYVGVLGLRLVKRTVNFDDPGSYHFYFGDEVGTPGTILTFFPWPNARRGSLGPGQVEATAYNIPTGSSGYWVDRLRSHAIETKVISSRFGEPVLQFADPDGMHVELIEANASGKGSYWKDGNVPAEQALQGFHGVTAYLERTEATSRVLTEVFGYRQTQQAGNRSRFEAQGGDAYGRNIDLVLAGSTTPGRSAAGSVHHIAFRAADDEQQLAWLEKVRSLGFHVSPVMDRTYFHSIYFREPGGVLFEIATDAPGFATDETVEELGTTLRLPSWMEKARPQIEGVLPTITLPHELNV